MTSCAPSPLPPLSLPAASTCSAAVLSSPRAPPPPPPRHPASLSDRLCSIAEDAVAVEVALSALPGAPAATANLRCGLWYCRPTPAPAPTPVYFMSKDGHRGKWAFSLRRLNLQLIDHLLRLDADAAADVDLDAAAPAAVAALVDSTSRGKTIPDSFSKTVPIWCCVLNTAAARLTGRPGWDTALHVPPGAVDAAEADAIRARVPAWVDALLALELRPLDERLRRLRAPLRPFWLTRSGVHHAGWDAAALSAVHAAADARTCYPVVCIVASATAAARTPCTLAVPGLPACAYTYQPGAADDEDAWADGLTPAAFWAAAASLVDAGQNMALAPATKVPAFQNPLLARVVWLPDVRLGLAALALADVPAAAKALPASYVLVACHAPASASAGPLIGLGMRPGKQGRAALLAALPGLAAQAPSGHGAAVVVCADGVTSAPAVALALLCMLAGGPTTKLVVAQQLARITAAVPLANPPRPLLKALNEYFMPDPRA